MKLKISFSEKEISRLIAWFEAINYMKLDTNETDLSIIKKLKTKYYNEIFHKSD